MHQPQARPIHQRSVTFITRSVDVSNVPTSQFSTSLVVTNFACLLLFSWLPFSFSLLLRPPSILSHHSTFRHGWNDSSWYKECCPEGLDDKLSLGFDQYVTWDGREQGRQTFLLFPPGNLLLSYLERRSMCWMKTPAKHPAVSLSNSQCINDQHCNNVVNCCATFLASLLVFLLLSVDLDLPNKLLT